MPTCSRLSSSARKQQHKGLQEPGFLAVFARSRARYRFRSIDVRLRSSIVFVVAVACLHPDAWQQPRVRPQVSKSQWTLTWSDEFDGRDGSEPDPGKWVAESGGGGWGNSELE